MMASCKALFIVAVTAFVSPVAANEYVCCTSCFNPLTTKAECNKFGVTIPGLRDILPAERGTIEECRDKGYPAYYNNPFDANCGEITGNCDASGCVATGAPPVGDCYTRPNCRGPVEYRQTLETCVSMGFTHFNLFYTTTPMCLSTSDGKTG